MADVISSPSRDYLAIYRQARMSAFIGDELYKARRSRPTNEEREGNMSDEAGSRRTIFALVGDPSSAAVNVLEFRVSSHESTRPVRIHTRGRAMHLNFHRCRLKCNMCRPHKRSRQPGERKGDGLRSVVWNCSIKVIDYRPRYQKTIARDTCSKVQ
jgi:hypothetical protein